MSIFTWLPFFEEMLTVICERYNKETLCKLFYEILGQTSSITDKFADGSRGSLKEIDPLTFISYFNRQIAPKTRIMLCDKAKNLMQLDAEVPEDFDAIPRQNNQNVWFFPYSESRKEDDIETLWNFAKALNELKLDNKIFRKVIDIKGVGIPKLTVAMFICKPEHYISFDNTNVKYFQYKGFKPLENIQSDIKGSETPFSLYKQMLEELKVHFARESFYKISHEAFLQRSKKSEENEKVDGGKRGKLRHWILRIPDKEKLDYCIENNLWMMQYEYGIQNNHGVTKNWRMISQVKEGDCVLLLLMNQNKFIAWGTAIKPRLKSDYTATYKDVIKKHKHDYNNGIIHYKDAECFYDNLNGQKLFDNQKWGQRIDVTSWENINQDGIIVSGKIKSINSNRGAVVEIEKEFFDEVKIQLGGFVTSDSHTISHPINRLQPKNIILYGPPGTGKTYSTINYALSIIENKDISSYEKEDRGTLRKKFENYQKNERVGFVSFHQSFSYEDFIEGIKPIEPEEKDEFLKYKIEDGIFKQMCVNSTYAIYRSLEKKNGDLNKVDFNSLYLEFITNLKKQKLEKENVIFMSKTNKEVHLVEVNNLNNIVLKPREGARSYLVSKVRLSNLYKAFLNINEIENIHEDIRNQIGGCNATFYWTIFKELKKFELELPASELSNEEAQEDIDYETKKELISDFTFKIYPEDVENYVLIIDEINRGNIANIFGELITLIEPDKRSGLKEALSTTLPYSKKEFTVPPNLHIIGTMNTADRSVEALDTALRRRFIFIEKTTDLSLIQQPSKLKVDLQAILKTINNRIEALLDKGHCIGHSYFMRLEDSINPEEDLRQIFALNILPLLEEYFYGDPIKIGMVLGAAFVEKKKYERNETLKFAQGFETELDDFERKDVYEIKNPLKFDNIEPFRSIYEG